MKIIKVSSGNNHYVGNFTSEENAIIKSHLNGKVLHLFSGKSDIGDVRVDFSFGNVKKDVFDFLKENKKRFDTIIIDAPYNNKFAEKYQKIGDTPKQFIIFADVKKTNLLWKRVEKIDPEIIILKSWNYYCLNRYEIKESYLCYAGGYRKPTILLIMKKKQKKLDSYFSYSH